MFSSVQSLSHIRLFATPWIAACQASLSITNSWSSLKLTSIESVMPSSHLIFCHPLFLLPLIPPSIRIFSNESTLRASQMALVVKNPPANAENTREDSSIPESGRSPGEGNDNPLQYSCLENSMDRGAWRAIVHGVTKSQTQLND